MGAKEEVFRVSRKQDKLKELLQSAYSNYYEIKYNLDSASLESVRDYLKDNQTTLVEFFWGDSAIFGLSIAGDDFAFTKIDVEPKLLDDINEFLAEIAAIPEGLEVDPHRVQKYARVAHNLYQILLHPLLSAKENTVDHLLVVSDGPLTGIPFEALLRTEVNNFDNGFHLPYLLMSFPISYAYSANLYLKNSKTIFPDSSRDLLAFSYSDQEAVNLKTGSLSILRGMGYDELPGTAKELKAIATLMDGQFYWGEDATESNFKALAPSYDILHLAIHGEGSQNVTSETKLVFRNNSDSNNDGSLYPHELYNMPLKARLVILSACETGMGEYYSGEGMFSIARAFAYSGNPSLICTFWKINDNTTYKLVSTLYENLVQGESVDQSLRNAKMMYLKAALGNAAHPSNWAALVAFGNTAPLGGTSTRSFLWPLILITLAAGGLFLWFRSRKST